MRNGPERRRRVGRERREKIDKARRILGSRYLAVVVLGLAEGSGFVGNSLGGEFDCT